MRIEKREAHSYERNVFGQYCSEDLGYDKTYYIMPEEEFEAAVLPDGQYGVAANDLIRSHIEFKPWEDKADCEWCIFDVKNGVKCDFKDVLYACYRVQLDFVIFE